MCDKNMDNHLVRKVMTFKSGQFVFSRNYDHAALESLFLEAKVLKETVADLPVLPWLAAELEEETIRRSIHSTAALEGNPLSEEQVGKVLSRTDQDQALGQAEIEIRNLRSAYQICRETPATGRPRLLDEELIKRFHRLITVGVEHPQNLPGSYREHWVKVGDREHGGVYTPPKIHADIESLMREFVAWINSEELLGEDPLVRAALAHFHLGKIHPFSDGNGRTARLVEALCLQAHGMGHMPVMLSNYYYLHPDEYYWAFSLSERNPENGVTPFVKFVLQAFIAALYETKDRMTGAIRRFALRDYLAYMLRDKKISRRQHDLGILLLEHPKPVGLPDLFREPKFALIYNRVSERTARRDLAHLLDKRLLVQDPQGGYLLNLRALDRV